MKQLIILVFVLMLGSVMSAQQEVMVSQYMFNGLLINPAYSGSHDYFSTSLLHRSQWVQFDKAPTTQVLAIDGPILNKKMGVGLVMTNDGIGVTNQFDIAANIAYRMPLGQGHLALGLKGGLATYTANLDDVIVWDENDPAYSSGNMKNTMVGKFGFGAYYHTNRYYIGLSVPNIYSLDDKLPIGETVDNYFTQHYYFNAGMVFTPNAALAIKPSFLVKYLPEAPVQVDLNCNILIYNRLWLGAGYRSGDSFIGMVEYNITPRLRAGYAHDFTTTDIKSYSTGSHEIMLGFDFGEDVMIKTKSPRYF